MIWNWLHKSGFVSVRHRSFRPSGDETVEDETVEDEAVEDETVGDETVGDKTVGGKTVEDEAVGDETVEDETVPHPSSVFCSMGGRPQRPTIGKSPFCFFLGHEFTRAPESRIATGSTGCGKTLSGPQEVSGRDFSRAVMCCRKMRALAPGATLLNWPNRLAQPIPEPLDRQYDPQAYFGAGGAVASGALDLITSVISFDNSAVRSLLRS